MIRITRLAACGMALAFVGAAAHAGDHGRRTAGPMLPKYQQECAGCHVAYPAGMLPAASWQRLMANLPRHFGTDASLDPTTLNEIGAWLGANAGSSRRVADAPPQDRITRSSWFIREHDEVPASTWQRASVKSPSNCTACHAQADQGDFNEHSVRIPR